MVPQISSSRFLLPAASASGLSAFLAFSVRPNGRRRRRRRRRSQRRKCHEAAAVLADAVQRECASGSSACALADGGGASDKNRFGNAAAAGSKMHLQQERARTLPTRSGTGDVLSAWRCKFIE
jgi:hypothetical protein